MCVCMLMCVHASHRASRALVSRRRPRHKWPLTAGERTTTEEGWLDELYHDPLRKNPPFPAKVVQALELELVELEQVFVKLGRMLWKGQLDQVRARSRLPC